MCALAVAPPNAIISPKAAVIFNGLFIRNQGLFSETIDSEKTRRIGKFVIETHVQNQDKTLINITSANGYFKPVSYSGLAAKIGEYASKIMLSLSKIAFTCSFIALAVNPAISAQESFSFHRDHVLGTSFDLTVVTDSEQIAKNAENVAIAEIERLNAILSTYNSESEISRLNRAETIVVSTDLLAVIQLSEMWRLKTNEAFSGRIGALLERWNEAEKTNTLPNRPELRVLAGEIRLADASIDLDTKTVTRNEPVIWALDGIAKGYIIDKAFEAILKSTPEASGILLDIGGDLRLQGTPPNEENWRIGVSDPQLHADNAKPLLAIALSQGAVATSGYSPRNYQIDGKSYSHILSTKSGWPTKHSVAATVIAPDAATADALATAFMSMNAAASINLVETLPHTETLLLTEDGRQFASSGWHDYIIPSSTQLTDSAHENQIPWPEGFQLKIDYEIPKPSESRYQYPYLAIWITDESKKLVRGLTMLGDNPQWVDENYVWWRRYGRKEPLLVDAISQPSRRPGRYKLVWNGIDDFGQHVPQGTYTLNIEAAREHGDHTLQKIELKLGNKKLRKRQKAEGEIGAIRVSYETK